MSHCLICSGLEPQLVVLDRKKNYLIGRDARAELFLPARQVSRRHAEISWSEAGGGFEVRDASSRRGVVINGKRTERHLLADDDELGIPPYRLRYRIYEGDLTPLQSLARPADWRIAGRFRGSELLELLALADARGLSAVLEVRGDAEPGTIVLSGGGIVRAELGAPEVNDKKTRGLRAACALLMTDSGRFELRAAPAAAPADGSAPIPLATVIAEILNKLASEVTVLDTSGPQQTDLLRLEKRLAAAATEKQLESLARRGVALAGDLARAQEFQQRMQRVPAEDGRLRFAFASRPASGVGGTIHSVSESHVVGARVVRVFVAEALGGGFAACLQSMIVHSEYELVNNMTLRPADVLAHLRRRLDQRSEPIQLRAACLDLAPGALPLSVGRTTLPHGIAVDEPAAERSIKAWTVTCSSLDYPVPVLLHEGKAAPLPVEPGAVTELDDGVSLITVAFHATRGDRVLLAASALLEQPDAHGETLGINRLAAAFTRAARAEPRAAVEALLSEADAFRGEVAQQGDYEAGTVEIR